MTRSMQALAVSPGIAIGRAVVLAAPGLHGLAHVAQYWVTEAQIPEELARARRARAAAVEELRQLRQKLPPDAPAELDALLDAHLLMLQDETMAQGIGEHIRRERRNAEWALSAQVSSLVRQFDGMADAYLRERKSDLEQLGERVLWHLLHGAQARDATPPGAAFAHLPAPEGTGRARARILVAHELSPADMLALCRQGQEGGGGRSGGGFSGLILCSGGRTSHTAIVARSMGIPAVLGAHGARSIQSGDVLVVDGNLGLVHVRPPRSVLRHHRTLLKARAAVQARVEQLRFAPARTLDGERVELLANIEQAHDARGAVQAGAVGVGLFRTEFLFMGRDAPPDEEAQYHLYRQALEGMQGLPLTIRTLDVGADKPGPGGARQASGSQLGLRGIRISLAEPAPFRTQLRAILRAAAHGPLHILLPMLTHPGQMHAALAQLRQARHELHLRGLCTRPLPVGAMVEVPAMALALHAFLPHVDFVSLGTNDLIQYTLAVDRGDEAVAHLYDPLHPAVLRLVAQVIDQTRAQGKPVCLCGEMAGDARLTALLLGLGLRSFSMPAAQILPVKEQILRADTRALQAWAGRVLQAEQPADLLASSPLAAQA